MKIQAIIHGLSAKRESIIKALEAHGDGIDLSISLTQRANHATEIAAHSDADVILSCGGDGTNHEIINGLLSTSRSELPALGFIPAGSGNDFVRSLASNSIVDVLNKVRSNKTQSVDIIKATHGEKTTYSINMCTSGISGRIAETANRRKQHFPAGLSYYSAIVQWLMKYRSPQLELTVDGATSRGDFFMVACGNGSYAGNGLGLSPQSTPFNGQLGLTTIGKVSVIDFLRYQSTLKKGEKIIDPRVEYHLINELQIRVLSGTLAIEADGESVARLSEGQSIALSLLPQALRIFS